MRKMLFVAVAVSLCCASGVSAQDKDPLTVLSGIYARPTMELQAYGWADLKETWLPDFQEAYDATCSFEPAQWEVDFDTSTTDDRMWNITRGISCAFEVSVGGEAFPATLQIFFTGPESVAGPLSGPIDLEGPTVPIATLIRFDSVSIPGLDTTWSWVRELFSDFQYRMKTYSGGKIENVDDILSSSWQKKLGRLGNGRSLILRGKTSTRSGQTSMVQMVARQHGGLWTQFVIMPEG